MKKSRIWNQKKNGRKLHKFALKTEKCHKADYAECKDPPKLVFH